MLPKNSNTSIIKPIDNHTPVLNTDVPDYIINNFFANIGPKLAKPMNEPWVYNGIQPESQNHCTIDSLIMKQKFIKKPLYVCFVDFTKAFDYVNRSALIYKLRERGVGGQFLRVIQSMYSKSKCKVKVNGELSEKIESLCGVLQGGMISPKLFNEYLYDLKSFLQLRFGIVLTDTIVQYILYADDLVLCSDTAEGLQEQIDGMYEFCKK